MDNRGWGRFKIFHQKFSVSHCRKTPYGNFSVLCFRIFPVVERILSKRARSFKFFLSNFFLSHKAENSPGGMFYCCNNIGYRKTLVKRGEVSRLSVEKFLSYSAENFRRGTV